MSNSRSTSNPEHVRAIASVINAAILDYCYDHPGEAKTSDIAEGFIAAIAAFLMSLPPPGPNHRREVIQSAEVFCHKALGIIRAIATDAP